MGLDAVEIVIATEQEFTLVISNPEAERCQTVAQLYELVLGKLRDRGENPDPAALFLKVQSIIAVHVGLRPDEVYPAARFIQDLGVD